MKAYHPIKRTAFGKDRGKALRGVARNLTVDEWQSCKGQYASGASTVSAPRGYRLSRSDVQAIARLFGEQV